MLGVASSLIAFYVLIILLLVALNVWLIIALARFLTVLARYFDAKTDRLYRS